MAGVAAAAVLLAVLACLIGGSIIRAGWGLADDADDRDRHRGRLDQACEALDTRLNRLVPPGATGGDPRRRADAVRDENSALRPLLAELEELTGGERDGARRHREWASSWRQLVEARATYADALERQATAGEPAFFVAPRAAGGDTIVEALTRKAPRSCDGAIRRLAQPDL